MTKPRGIGRGRGRGSASGQFTPGNKVAVGKTKRSGRQAPLVLQDMRAVYAQTPDKDKTEGQRTCRQLLNESPIQFLNQLHRLEIAWQKRQEEMRQRHAASPSGQLAGNDPGTQNAREQLQARLDRLARQAREPQTPVASALPATDESA